MRAISAFSRALSSVQSVRPYQNKTNLARNRAANSGANQTLVERLQGRLVEIRSRVNRANRVAAKEAAGKHLNLMERLQRDFSELVRPSKPLSSLAAPWTRGWLSGTQVRRGRINLTA